MTESRIKPKNLEIGYKFGKLTITDKFVKRSVKHFSCKCDCGNSIDVKIKNFYKTYSCGCEKRIQIGGEPNSCEVSITPEYVKMCQKVVNDSIKVSFFNIPREEMNFISQELQEDNFNFEDKTILICGAFGFLGKLFQSYFLHLNENILRIPCKVICVDNFIVSKKYSNLNIDNFTYIYHDICEPVHNVLNDYKIDYLINLAGIASPLYYQKYPFETIDVSYTGTVNMLNLMDGKKISSGLFMSSSEVYGTPDDKDIPTKETTVLKLNSMDTRSPYDTGKILIETLCNIAHTKNGVNCKIIRPFNVFGYIPKSDGRVIPNFISNLIDNKKIRIYGAGNQTRTFCWFTDFIVGAIRVLLYGDNSPYNIGNPNNEITMLALAKMIEEICGRKDMIELIPSPQVYKHEPQRRCPDISKAKDDLKYEPKISLSDGIKKFYSWAQKEYSVNIFP